MPDLTPWRAKFETMVLPFGLAKEPIGPFVVEVYDGRNLGSMHPYWKSCLIPTRQKFGIKGYRSAKKAMEAVEPAFRKKVEDWVKIS